MMLELADASEMFLPAYDNVNNEIFMVNPAAVALMPEIERDLFFQQLPVTIALVQRETVGEMYADRIKREAMERELEKQVQQFAAMVDSEISANMMRSNLAPSGQQKGEIVYPQEYDPRFAFSASLEPSPKPWFARTEVLLPVGIAALGAIYLLTRKR